MGPRVVALASLLLACRAAPQPTAQAPDEPGGCGEGLLAASEAALDLNLRSPFPCDPRPGAAGWVRGDRPAFAPDPRPPQAEPSPPLALHQPRFALVLDGRGAAQLDVTLATLRAEADYRALVASPSPPPRSDEHASPTLAGVTALIASLRRQLAPGAVLVVVAAEVLEAPDEPWGCVPLADTCLALSHLQRELDDIRSGARVVVLEQAAPRLGSSALADAATVVVAFPEGQVGTAAAQAFWSRRVPDRDRDGVLSVRERAEHARRLTPDVRLVDPLGVLSFGRRPARASGSAPLEVHGRAELDQALAGLRPGELAVVNLSTSWCEACRPFAAVFDALARRTGGPLRFIHAETDEQWDGFVVRSYPAVAFIAPGGRVLGFAADPGDPLASLHLTQFDALEDQLAHLRAGLRSHDAYRRGQAVQSILALGPPGAALIDDLARALHDETDAGIIFAILQALGGHGDKARHAAPELVALFNHKDDGVRALAVHHLQAHRRRRAAGRVPARQPRRRSRARRA